MPMLYASLPATTFAVIIISKCRLFGNLFVDFFIFCLVDIIQRIFFFVVVVVIYIYLFLFYLYHIYFRSVCFDAGNAVARCLCNFVIHNNFLSALVSSVAVIECFVIQL